MVDVHCHILHGIDDGSYDLNESLLLAKTAVDQRTRHVIATPHHANGRYSNEATFVRAAVEQLNTHLQQSNISLEVHVGQEIRVQKDFLDMWDAGELLTLNDSKYILLELPFREIPDYMEALFHELKLLNLVPVLAHPERNKEIVTDVDKVIQWVQQGVLMQLTAGSITGKYGKRVQQFCFNLCERNIVHLIASDAHNMTTRPFILRQAYDLIESKLGADYVEYYQDNANAILLDQEIRYRPLQDERRKWYQLWK